MENFDADRNGLKPLGVKTWGPFVFLHLGGAVDGEDAAPGAVNLSPSPPQPIEDAFRAAGLKEEDYAGPRTSPLERTRWTVTGRCSATTTWTEDTTSRSRTRRSPPGWRCARTR